MGNKFRHQVLLFTFYLLLFNKFRHHLLLFTFYFLLFTFSGCSPETRCDTPMGDASCQLDLIQYPNLTGGNGYEYIVGCYQGVVVIRTSLEQYVA